MRFRTHPAIGTAVGLWLALAAVTLARVPAQAQIRTAVHTGTAPQERTVTARATGNFEVKLNPLAPYNDVQDGRLGRMSIDKQFRGELEAVSKGEMLSAGTEVQGSAGYVAIERVSGTLHGRKGSFVLQHSGTMNRGAPQLVVSVVPDSGTGELVGLAGTMSIDNAGGKHAYIFEYTLAAAP